MKLRTLFLFACCLSTTLVQVAFGQTLLSQYEFNGDLNNSSSPSDDNGMVAPDGTFREGASAGTATFVTGVDGVPGNAVRLNGIDQWIDITVDGHPGSQTPANLFNTRGPGIVSGTVTAWIKATTSPEESEQRWLMGSSNSDDSQSFRFGWDGDRLTTEAQPSDSATPFAVLDNTADDAERIEWADGSWHHIAAVWRASTGFGTFYVDGTEVSTPGTSGSNFNSTNTQTAWEFAMAIGARNNSGTLEGFWEGAIDDLRIYGDSLSDSQIQAVIDEVDVAVTPDFDIDDDVDGNDFLIWQRGFGTGSSLSQGDANNSNTVDEVDLTIWEGSYGTIVTPPFSALHTVPEPTTLALLLLAGTACLTTRRCS